MPDQIPQLPVPSAEDIKKFKAKVPSGGVSVGGGLPIPSPEDIKRFKIPVAEKKKPMASPSVLEKPVVSSVAGLRPMQPSLVSSLAAPKSEIKPLAPQENVSVTGSQGKLLIPQKPFYEFNLPPAQQQAPPTTSKVMAQQPVTAPQEEIVGSQGKLLIPEPTKKFPAVTETVTTYKNVPVTAPSKNTKNVPLNPELMLQAIAKNEGGKLGVKTAIKGKGTSNTASGTYQITEGTLENIYNKDVDFKKSYDNFQQFKKEFNSNPEVEHQAALSHMSDLIKQFGIHALTAWYSPDHAARAAAGSKSALKEVPRRDAGNTISAGKYFNNAFANYKNLLGKQPEQVKTARIPVKQEVIKEPAIEVPSLEKFNVLSPNWYGGPVTKQVEPKPTKKVGALEDIGNTFMSSGSNFASGIAGLPNFAQKAGLMMTTKMLGIDDEYNALPVQAKREIDSVMSDISQRGGIPSGNFSREAQSYFIKKSNEFLENTNKSDKYLNDRVGDFFKNPSIEKATDLFLEIPKGFAGSLPYMINPMLGAVSAASTQYNKDINEADGKLGWGQLVNAGVTGVSEYYIEKISNNILNKSVRDAAGLPKVASELAMGFVKSVLKDVGLDSAGEGLTQFAQSISDDITKGREIDWVKTANEVLDATITGAGIAAGMRTTGAGIGYLAKKVMPNSEKNKVDRNTRAIMDLNTKKGPDNSPQVNAVIDSKIKELDDDNKNIINSNIDKVKSLSDNQLKEIVGIDKSIEAIYNQRDAIVADPNLNDEEKQSLLDHLKSQATTLNQQKDAIQKQTTSEVPVQPEAGARVQMAQGEPQAEPQVPAQEGQREEIETRRQEELAPYASQTAISEETFEGISPDETPVVYVVRTMADGSRQVRLQLTTDGKVETFPIAKHGKDITFSNSELMEKSYGVENGKSISVNNNPINPTKINKINEKYDAELAALESQPKEIVDITANIPKQDLPKVMDLVAKIERGEQPSSPEDLQIQQNYAKEVEALLNKTANKQNENIPTQGPRAEVPAQETAQGEQPQQGAPEQPVQASNKRGEIKNSLERLKDKGVLRSAITGRKDISQGEIDTQMALTDAMANVWKETTGRDDFYENFFNDVSEGDIDAIMEKGGVLFQNLELPRRPLTRVSLGVFDLPEFKRMEGQEVSINSVKDLARTRGKQIEKDLMQTVLDYDKYKDVKKISFDEFKSDVEVQVMKLEKIKTSSYASYGMDNLGDSGVYGDTNTIIYNSPVDHGEYGHFSGDFKYYSVVNGNRLDITEWDIKQIPGTDQYVAMDRSMPDNTPQDQISNYVGTAGSKESVERWVRERVVPEGAGDINVGLFGHTRVWYAGKSSPYYLAELQSDYFQKNDPNDLYASQVEPYNASTYAYEKYNKENRSANLEKIKDALNVKIEIEDKNIDGAKFSYANAYLYKENGEKLINAPIYKQLRSEGGDMSKDDWDDNLFNEIGSILSLHTIPNQKNTREEFRQLQENDPESLRAVLYKYKSAEREINSTKYKLLKEYTQEYTKTEIEKIKNSEKGVSMLKQFVASQKIHEIRLLREALRNASQEGAETLRFPTPYTLAVIEGYVNKEGEDGAPYEIISGNREGLNMGDEIDYGGTRMTILDSNNTNFTAAPTDEVFYYNYFDYINSEVEHYLDDTLYTLRKGFQDIGSMTESEIDDFDFNDLPWQASDTQDILRNAINNSETGTISLQDVEETIADSIRESLNNLSTYELFYGDEIFSDGGDGYYVVERSNQIENFNQPDQYENESNVENFEENISSQQQTVVNKYKELNKVFKKMRPDAEVVTDDNGMQWLETKLSPEDTNNPVIAFQEEGGNIKGAVDFSNDNKASVYMFNGADVSTLAHEMSGHLSRRFLEQLSNVDEDFASDYEKAKKWAGVKDNQWTIAAEEKWARGFERYLRDGKAPTKALKSVFDNLREWLKNIYKYIKGSSIDIKLTPEITRVFDNLLGARSEVEFKNLPGYARMMGEVKGIVDKSFKRGVSYAKTMDNAIQYMSKSKVYENATDIQREAMVREVRKMFKQKEKKAPTVQKILGQEPTKTTVVIDEAKEINKRLKGLEAAEQTGKKIGYKQGITEAETAKKEVLDYVKSLKVNNKISGSQYKAIINAINTNLRNPVIRKRAEQKIEKIINKANYADQLDRAGKLNKAIRKAAKSKTLPANISSMAKKFAKVNPNNVDNIDEYIDMANIVYASVSKPIRIIAEEAMVNEYSDMKIKEAHEAEKKALLDEYNYLVDAGLIESGMSMQDIQQYILDVEGKKIESKKDEEQKIRKRLNSLFNVLSGGANAILEDGVNPFTGEEVDLTAEDRQLLKDFTAMDLDKLPIASAYRAQEALMNYIVNGKKFGMRGILARYQGAENVKVAINKGLKASDFRWAVGGSWWGSRKWAKEVESIPGLFTWLWRGRTRGGEMMKLMGLDEFMAGAAKGKLERIEAENEYIAKFLKTKPNGKRFNNINNTYERLVYAYLSRTVDGTEEQKQAEFERRQRILAQNVQAMYQSRNKELIEEGKILEKELNKVKDAKTIDDIQGKFDKINEDAVKFISGKFDQNFDFVEGVAEGIYNLILNKDELYTPDMFRSIVEKDVNVAEAQETVDLPFDLLNKKPAGTMMENKRIQNLPGYDIENKDASNVDKILRLDFDASAFNALEKALVDANTAESVQKYSAFVNSKDFNKLFDNVKDQTLFKEIVNFYINNERGKIGYKSDWKAVQNFTNRMKSLSTYRALGSISAIVKQSASAAINTVINLSNDPYALKQVGNAMFFSSDIQDFINNNKGEINLRGAESTADIKSAEKLIRDSKYQTLNDVLDVVDKAGRLQMKPLAAGDVPLARASWFGYYVHALKEQGKPYKNIDWKTEKIDKDALAYANREVSINQNASMPSTMGRAFSSKNPATKLIMAYVFPYTSFLFNAKSRLKTDITVLTSKLATTEDKQAAGRSMAATLAELPAYIVMQTAINYALVGVANVFLGYNEDEEDEKLRLKRYSELAVTRIITDLLSPTPNVGDVATVAAFNALLAKMQEEPDMTKEEKMDVFKLFESKPESMAGAMAELLAQPISSTGRRAADIYTTFDMINGDYYVTESGKEIEFTAEDKKMLKIAGAMQVMGSLNLLPSEAESLAKKMVKTIEKRAKE